MEGGVGGGVTRSQNCVKVKTKIINNFCFCFCIKKYACSKTVSLVFENVLFVCESQIY